MVDEPGAEDFDIEALIDQLRTENDTLKDQALRYAAEAENTKRRAEREMNDAKAYAIQRFAQDLLGVADNLSRAIQHAPADAADPAVKNLAVGLEMTEKALISAFERNGLKKIDPAKGAKFDPNVHQAMMEQPSDEVGAGVRDHGEPLGEEAPDGDVVGGGDQETRDEARRAQELPDEALDAPRSAKKRTRPRTTVSGVESARTGGIDGL
jgi:molecular chaperone GrpE (heat shock protein)